MITREAYSKPTTANLISNQVSNNPEEHKMAVCYSWIKRMNSILLIIKTQRKQGNTTLNIGSKNYYVQK